MATDKTIVTRVAPLESSLSANQSTDLPFRANRTFQALTFLEALVFSGLVAMFIWRWQAADPYSWVIFPVWLLGSFLLHQDTPKTLGWRADNLWPATRQGLWMFAAFIAAIVIAGISLGALHRTPQHLLDRHRFIGYFAFCTLQQVAVNSYLMNRYLFATSTLVSPSNDSSDPSTLEHPIIAATLSSLTFGALHWPNPVLVPVTLIGGFGMCLLFAKQRNILPLTLGQAILGGLTWWAFPIAWHHSMRVGPGYYAFAHRLVNW
ncbi:MAG: CPBP family intramembrane metalloprotease [Acidobacteria bacterium]|nr:CPBP family intramembrane metalloprotease [Acidobacteriota bacterium]